MNREILFILIIILSTIKINGQYTNFRLDDNDREKILFNGDDNFFYSSKYFLESIKNKSRDNYKNDIIKSTVEYKSYKSINTTQTLLKIGYFNESVEYSFFYIVLSNINCSNRSADIDIAENINLSQGFKNLMETPKKYIPTKEGLIDKTVKAVISLKCEKIK